MRGAIQEKERENERREIEVGYSPKSSREGWVTVEREKKTHKLREKLFLTWPFLHLWMVGVPSVIHLFKNGRK